MSVSTHVLDAVHGRPAAGVAVSLTSASGAQVGAGVTDADGRVTALAGDLEPGVYRLRFDVETPFYPEVVIAFRVTDSGGHHHVPLLLSPYAYSTYRGS